MWQVFENIGHYGIPNGPVIPLLDTYGDTCIHLMRVHMQKNTHSNMLMNGTSSVLTSSKKNKTKTNKPKYPPKMKKNWDVVSHFDENEL